MADAVFAGRWPGETAEYRAARDALAQTEHDHARGESRSSTYGTDADDPFLSRTRRAV